MLGPDEDLDFELSAGRIKPVTYKLEAGRALGISSLATITHLKGEDADTGQAAAGGKPLEITCFFPPRVLVKKGNPEKFEASCASKAKMVASNFTIDCSKGPYRPGVAVADIAMGGLGWVSIQGRGLFKIRVEGPSEMKTHLRPSPLMPFEGEKAIKFHGSPQRAQTAMRRKGKRKPKPWQ